MRRGGSSNNSNNGLASTSLIRRRSRVMLLVVFVGLLVMIVGTVGAGRLMLVGNGEDGEVLGGETDPAGEQQKVANRFKTSRNTKWQQATQQIGEVFREDEEKAGSSSPSPSALSIAESVATQFLNRLRREFSGGGVSVREASSAASSDNEKDSTRSSSSAFYRANDGGGGEGTIVLPYTYPLHLALPKDRTAMTRAILAQFFEKPSSSSSSSYSSSLSSSQRLNESSPNVRRLRDQQSAVDYQYDYDGASSSSSSSYSPSAPLFSTANAGQCLALSQSVGVLYMDEGAFAATSVIKGDAATSAALEKEYGFDNRRLHSPTAATTVEVGEEGGNGWGSATFYRGPPSDGELPNSRDPSVRREWAQQRVRWVASTKSGSGSKKRGNPEEEKKAAANEEAEIVDHHYDHWRDYDDEAEDGNLPCTQYFQHRLHALMNPQQCLAAADGGGGDDGDDDPFEVRSSSSSPPKYLVSYLKSPSEGYGTGAAISLVAYDMLSAIVLNRVLLMSGNKKGGPTSKWHFAGESCAAAGKFSWDCFWQFPSKCQYEVDNNVKYNPMKIKSKKDALRRGEVASITKENFDASGLGRNDVPSDEEFFGRNFVNGIRSKKYLRAARRRQRKEGGHADSSSSSSVAPKCYQRYKDWAHRDLSHTYIQGTFSKGADPRLFYMMAQVMRYLLRYQQPWYYNMLAQGLGYVGMGVGTTGRPSSSLAIEENAVPAEVLEASPAVATIYLHERGEINKFREYYSNFGCHNVKSELLIDLATAYCLGGNVTTAGGGSGSGGEWGPSSSSSPSSPNCKVFISGNTPSGNYKFLRDTIRRRAEEASPSSHSNGGRKSSSVNDNRLTVRSTWNLFEPRHQQEREGEGSNRQQNEEQQNGGAAETARWGASSPSAGWIDLYAGVSASHWVCIVQSNWCRLVNWLRLTSGRATCGGFADVGALMISSPTLRDAYCIVNMSWPTKPFSNRIK